MGRGQGGKKCGWDGGGGNEKGQGQYRRGVVGGRRGKELFFFSSRRRHTRYLVFAVLPQEWSEEDEKRARAEWPIKIRREDGEKGAGEGEVIGMSRRQKKHAERQARIEKAAADAEIGKAAVEVKEASTATEEPKAER